MDYIKLELLMFKAKNRKSYKVIADEAGISYNCLIKYTSGSRRLTEDNMEKLISYLSAHREKEEGES